MILPPIPSWKEPGEEEPMPRAPAVLAMMSEPSKVEVPRPSTSMRLAAEKEVVLAMGRLFEAVVLVTLMATEEWIEPPVTWRPEAVERSPEEMGPVKVEVPAPETVRRSATEKEVDDAIGNVDVSVVEVARKVEALTVPAKTAAPVTPKVAPGEVEERPRSPAAESVNLVEVATATPPLPSGTTILKRSAVWPVMPRTTNGMELVEVDSMVATAFTNGLVVPIAN
jgi:hypothetical protein